MADLVIATAPIDALLGYRFGPLEWRGYRIETEVVDGSGGTELGLAPDGIPFAWLYTPWAETPVCRTTDFGVIHHGPERGAARRWSSGRSSTTRCRCTPSGGRTSASTAICEEASRIRRRSRSGGSGSTSTSRWTARSPWSSGWCSLLESYLAAKPAKRFEILRAIRGDWDE